jgi:hypothetical protein
LTLTEKIPKTSLVSGFRRAASLANFYLGDQPAHEANWFLKLSWWAVPSTGSSTISLSG